MIFDYPVAPCHLSIMLWRPAMFWLTYAQRINCMILDYPVAPCHFSIMLWRPAMFVCVCVRGALPAMMSAAWVAIAPDAAATTSTTTASDDQE